MLRYIYFLYIACDDDTKSEIVVPVYASHYHNESVTNASSTKKVSTISMNQYLELYYYSLLKDIV